ncbi:MAG: iron ABC transporter permease [Actinomycetota bacterium]
MTQARFDGARSDSTTSDGPASDSKELVRPVRPNVRRRSIDEPDRRSRDQPHLLGGLGYVVLMVCLAIGSVFTLMLSVSVGALSIPLGDVAAVVWSHLRGQGPADVDPVIDQIVWEFRFPRALLAFVVGSGLAVAGTALQALVRNPLADPYILGIASGASLGAVTVIVLGSSILLGLGVAAAAFVFALATMVVVLLLGRQGGRLQPTRMLLAGVALSFVLSAATSYVQFQADPRELRTVLNWLLGSLAAADWPDVVRAAPVVLLSTAWLALRGRDLNALLFGEESAHALGVNVNRFRLEIVLVSCLLTASVVAVAGAIGFVGLVIPHIVRLIVGPDHRRVLPACLLLGGLYLMAVDILSRVIERPAEVPLGILTSAIGVPVFLILLRRQGRLAGAS